MSIESSAYFHGDNTPYDTLVDENGDVSVQEDADARITNDFMYPSEIAQLEAEEAAAIQESREAEYELLIAQDSTEQAYVAKMEIQSLLAELAVDKLVVLQQNVIDARQHGDETDYQRALAKLNKHIEMNPGIAEPLV